MVRIVLAVVSGITACFGGFVLFNVAYIQWAVWRYPHNNSMAGLAAFYYGIPVALACGVAAVFGILRWRKLEKLP